MKTTNKPVSFKTFTKAVILVDNLMKLIMMPDDKNIEERKAIIGHLIEAQHKLLQINKKGTTAFDKEVKEV